MPKSQSNPLETSAASCQLCGSQHAEVIGSKSRSGGALRTVICKDCGLVWSDPFPYDPRQFYQDEYRLAYKNTYTPKLWHILRAGRVALERHHKIKPLLNQQCTVLDVGAGGGEFGYLIKSLGHDLHGVEPNHGYAEYARNLYALNLQVGFVQDADYADQSFNIITIWHVLEHTENPGLVLGKLCRLLKADGTLIVEVPNIEATCQAPGSTFHEAHLFNFNLATLSKLGEKAGLLAERHQYSNDLGNLTVYFRKAPLAPSPECNWSITGNAEQITKIIRKHSVTGHFLHPAPYLRFLRRIIRVRLEKRAARRFENSKSLLDALYAPTLGTR